MPRYQLQVDIDGDGISDCRDSVNICEPATNVSGLAEECLSVGSFDFAHIFVKPKVPQSLDEFDLDEDGAYNVRI